MEALKGLSIGIICSFLMFLVACASVESYSEKHALEGVRLVAVMPVSVKGDNNQVEARTIRSYFIDELYFRGYPKIPTSLVDEAIAAYEQGASREAIPKENASLDYGRDIPSSRLREVLGVDAIVYIDVEDFERRVDDFSATYVLDINFRIIDARTGQELWKRRYKSSGWTPGVSKLRMEMENTKNYGRSLLEVVRNAVTMLPIGKGL